MATFEQLDLAHKHFVIEAIYCLRIAISVIAQHTETDIETVRQLVWSGATDCMKELTVQDIEVWMKEIDRQVKENEENKK